MRKKKTSPKNGHDLFFDIFIGEFVDIITERKTTRISVNQESGETEQLEIPMIISGYILDEDDSYYFIGATDRQVSHAVKKSIVDHVSISSPDGLNMEEIEYPKTPVGELN